MGYASRHATRDRDQARRREPQGAPRLLHRRHLRGGITEQTKEYIVLHKMENDISPLLKTNGYFGITQDGTLSIYNGKPADDKIIHTFFQIDVGKLEVYQQEELQQGIQIISKDQFNSLMEEYSEYAVQPNY